MLSPRTNAFNEGVSVASQKRLVFRWTAPKGFAAIVVFSALALLMEYFLVNLFLSTGLRDENLLIWTSTNPAFTITLSPLFHLVPLGVTVVLVASWTYITKYVAAAPRVEKPREKPSIKRRKKYPGWFGRRLRSIRNFFKWINKKLQRANRAIKAPFNRISSRLARTRVVSYLSQRLHFARATIKSTVTVLFIFSALALTLYVLGYPKALYNGVTTLYKGSPASLGFVSWLTNIAHAIGKALAPLGWLASAINNALLAASPGFRNALLSLGTPVVKAVTNLDPTVKYLLCQNIAAWICAVSALAYGWYATRLYRRRGKRR